MNRILLLFSFIHGAWTGWVRQSVGSVGLLYHPYMINE